jgi:hypothetical protein
MKKKMAKWFGAKAAPYAGGQNAYNAFEDVEPLDNPPILLKDVNVEIDSLGRKEFSDLNNEEICMLVVIKNKENGGTTKVNDLTDQEYLEFAKAKHGEMVRDYKAAHPISIIQQTKDKPTSDEATYKSTTDDNKDVEHSDYSLPVIEETKEEIKQAKKDEEEQIKKDEEERRAKWREKQEEENARVEIIYSKPYNELTSDEIKLIAEREWDERNFYNVGTNKDFSDLDEKTIVKLAQDKHKKFYKSTTTIEALDDEIDMLALAGDEKAVKCCTNENVATLVDTKSLMQTSIDDNRLGALVASIKSEWDKPLPTPLDNNSLEILIPILPTPESKLPRRAGLTALVDKIVRDHQPKPAVKSAKTRKPNKAKRIKNRRAELKAKKLFTNTFQMKEVIRYSNDSEKYPLNYIKDEWKPVIAYIRKEYDEGASMSQLLASPTRLIKCYAHDILFDDNTRKQYDSIISAGTDLIADINIPDEVFLYFTKGMCVDADDEIISTLKDIGTLKLNASKKNPLSRTYPTLPKQD